MTADMTPSTWWQCEPLRLARDQREVASLLGELIWHDTGAGRWTGSLPRWPFDRAEPPALIDLIGERGLQLELVYGHAYPMAPPRLYPTDPQPLITEWTVHDWHVNGDGSLCLLRDEVLWDPRASVADLLVKAAGWRVEYALMKAQVLDRMSENGIVSDDALDDLVDAAVTTLEEGA